jgi:N-acetyl-anhydromuramyl-L-alanine amidase AmpD
MNLIDRRKFAAQAHGPKGKWKVGRRPASKVTGICLHQTACVLGERPERWDTVGAHVGITRSGAVIWLHDFTHVVAHGNGWNKQTVGIEIDGLYAGIEGDDSTVWDDPSTRRREVGLELPEVQAEAAREAVRWIAREARDRGAVVRALVAHRQSSADRRNDPGSAIWQRVALPMSVELGLSDGGPGFRIGDGMAIPEAWDVSRKGVAY